MGRRGVGRLALLVLVAITGAGLAASPAGAYVVRGANGHLYGIWAKPKERIARAHALQRAVGDRVQYQGGSVMLSSNLHLIFWGPNSQWSGSYTGPIVQWARDLAADSGKTTNEFSIGSLYYRTNPNEQISRNVSFGGAILDTQPYPANGCTNPSRPRTKCLSDAQVQAEITRDIAAEHWPTDPPHFPVNQYLLFTPSGVASCDDNTETSCTFSGNNGYCAYHSSIFVGQNAAVYSNIPYLSDCDSGQAPSGVFGSADADGALDDTIHEVLESATDPLSAGGDDYAWTDSDGNEIGDECVPDSGSVYGNPLGGSLGANTAFNQVIGGHTYYTQEIWAIRTPFSGAAACQQRVGPTPVFNVPAATAGTSVSFDGSHSFDLVGRITAYIWSFGDGSPLDTTSSPHAVHVYAQPGRYQVSLAVVDASGFGNATAATHTEVVK